MRRLLFLMLLVTLSTPVHAASVTGGTNLPYRLYLDALTETPEYDEDLDYMKLGSTNIKQTITTVIKKGLVDKVVVNKSRYRMYLYKGNKLVTQFLIALGANPVGPKEFEGDKKTPEGSYILDYIKLNSNYYKAFHISYPNAKNISYASSKGRRAGGMIMVHGQPTNRSNDKNDLTPGLQSSNWTNGCIALMNQDMDKFLELVDPGTEILITP